MARLVIAILALFLAACQTMQPPTAFSDRQKAVLEASGFVAVGTHYEFDMNDRVLFAFDRSDLIPEKAQMLSNLAGTLKGIGIGGLSVEGHTDSTGASRHNQRLSGLRAEAVRARLLIGGMDARHIRIIRLGETDPIASNETSEGRAQNRRVVIVVTPADAIPL